MDLNIRKYFRISIGFYSADIRFKKPARGQKQSMSKTGGLISFEPGARERVNCFYLFSFSSWVFSSLFSEGLFPA
jgi:hypothetical protein